MRLKEALELLRAGREGVAQWNRWYKDAKPNPSLDPFGLDLRGADFCDADLRNADLSDANLSHANFRGANLARTDFRKTYLFGADLSHADLSEAIMCQARLIDANLSYTNLRAARFALLSYGHGALGGNLQGATLNGADLSHANLCGLYLCDTTLCDVTLTDAIVGTPSLARDESSCGSLDDLDYFERGMETRFPECFKLPADVECVRSLEDFVDGVFYRPSGLVVAEHRIVVVRPIKELIEWLREDSTHA